MLLHMLNRSPASSRISQDTLRSMGKEDRLLLIEDGVYGTTTPLVEQFAEVFGRLFVLREDLASRGLAERCDERVIQVDMDGFVTLTEEAERTVSWF